MLLRSLVDWYQPGRFESKWFLKIHHSPKRRAVRPLLSAFENLTPFLSSYRLRPDHLALSTRMTLEIASRQDQDQLRSGVLTRGGPYWAHSTQPPIQFDRR